MNNFKLKLRPVLQGFLRVLPLLCMGIAVIWFLSDGKNVTIDDILSYSPESPIAAALFLWAAFAVKSLSLMFPVLLLFAVGGRLFPLPLAFLINTAGIAITLSLPYFVGRFSGADLTERLMKKYPRLYEMRAERNKNPFFFSFIVRAVGILPCDVVSLYSGNTRLSYTRYIAGGILGFMPDLICATIVGKKISEPGSPWFWLTIIINIFICLLFIFIYSARRKKAGKKEKGGRDV